MQDVYENIEEYNPNKKHTKLIVFDDMFADMLSNKKLHWIATELVFRAKKLLLFHTISFAVSKNIRPNFIQYFIKKIPNKQGLQQSAFNPNKAGLFEVSFSWGREGSVWPSSTPPPFIFQEEMI